MAPQDNAPKSTKAANTLNSVGGYIAYAKSVNVFGSDEELKQSLLKELNLTNSNNDPWGRPYQFVEGGTPFKFTGMFSLGEDGLTKSAGNDPDDVNSWNTQDRVRFYTDRYYSNLKSRFCWSFLASLVFTACCFVLFKQE